MRKAFIIAQKDIGETLRSRSTYIALLVLLAITFSYFSGLNGIVNNARAGGLENLKAAIMFYLNTMISTLPLTIAMLIAGPFSSFSMLLEKAKHNFESLLSTSISLREVWLGKSLSVFLPCIITSLAISLLAIVILNLIIIIPVTGIFIVPDSMFVLTGFVFIPVLVFFIVALISLLQLVLANPRIPTFVFSAVFFAIYFGTLTKFVAELNLVAVYLAVIAILAVVTFYCMRFLTKERVILSSKG